MVLDPGPRLGQAPSCCTTAAVGQRERTDAAVQGVRGSTRTCRGRREEADSVTEVITVQVIVHLKLKLNKPTEKKL